MRRPRKHVRPRLESLEPRIVMGYYSADAVDETPLPTFPTPCPPVPGENEGGSPPPGGSGGWDGMVDSRFTSQPVRSLDGTPLISGSDLNVAGSPAGFSWGITRTWSGLNNAGPVGNGWTVGEMPYLVVGGGTNGGDSPFNPPGGGVAAGTAQDDRISVVQGGTTVSTFGVVPDGNGGFTYAPWDSTRFKLERIAAVEPILRLTDAQGNVSEFYDVKRDATNRPINSTMAVDSVTKYGRFKSYTSASEVQVDTTYTQGILNSQVLSGPANNVLERIVYGYASVTNDLVSSSGGSAATLLSVATLQRPNGMGGWYDVQRAIYSYYTGRITDAAQNTSNDPNGRLGDLKTVETQNAVAQGGSTSWRSTNATYFRYYKFTGESYNHDSYGPTNSMSTTGGPAPLLYNWVDRLVSSGLKTVVTGQSLTQLAAAIPSYQSASDESIRPFVNHFFRYERWADHVGADGRDNAQYPDWNQTFEWRTSYRTGTRYRAIEELAQGEGCSCSTGQGTYKYEYTANYGSPGLGYNSFEANTWRMKLTEFLPSNAPGWGTHDRQISYVNERGQSLLDVFVDVGDDARPIGAISTSPPGSNPGPTNPTDPTIPTASTSGQTGSGQGNGLTIYVTSTGHGFATGDRVAISGVLPAMFDGVFNVTRIDADHFSFTLPATFRSPGQPTPTPKMTAGVSTATKVLGEWISYQRYDASGRVVLEAAPSATSGYEESWAGLVDDGTGNYPGLWPSSGLIRTFSYYADTTAAATTPGGVAGILRASFVQRGRTGSPIVTESTTYYTHANAAGAETFVIATDTGFGLDSGNALDFSDRAPRTTSYAYAWNPGTNQVAVKGTARPVVGAAQNGPGVADYDVTVYDIYGRPTWSRDGDGFIKYQEYDAASGSLVRTIVDVNTALPGTPASLPTGWATPSGGGKNLVTAMAVDAQGRTNIMVDANGHATYWVYNDAAHEVRMYRGWDALTGTTTGPIEVTRSDWARNYRESFAMATAPSVTGTPGNFAPTGAEGISGIVSLTRQLLDASHRVAETDVYVSFAGITYSSTALLLGSPGANYDATIYGYDDRGRQVRTLNAVGTVTIAVYDGQGRLTATYVGTDDSTPNGYRWTPGTGGPNSNMKLVASYTYDGGGVGDGTLTETTQYPDGDPAHARTTRYAYDWRDRLVAAKVGVQAVEDAATNRLISFLDLNNLGEVLSTATYDGDGVTLSTTRPAAGLLRAFQATDYDDQGRIYRQRTFGVDPATGAVNPSALTTLTFYDRRGHAVAVYHPGGLATKTTFDGAGRAVLASTTDQFGGTSWASAATLGTEHVLEQTLTTYDGVGNVIQATTAQRAHDAPADLLGSFLTTAADSTTPPLRDMGFEAAAQVAPGQFLYYPTNTPWRFNLTAGLYAGGAGVAGNYSGFTIGNGLAPEGQLVAFIQANGEFSQSVAGWAAGVYRISFQAAQRGNYQSSSQDFQVLVDDRVVGTFRPSGTSYEGMQTIAFTVAAGAHVVKFRGLNTNGGDNTAFIDAVSIHLDASSANGTGLLGTYFDSPNLVFPVMARVDASVDFDWGQGSFAPNHSSDGYSVRWTGRILAPVSGPITFNVVSDDGTRVWIDDQLVINTGGFTTWMGVSGTITLEAGRLYSIRVEYQEIYYTASVTLRWSAPGLAQQVVPQAYLYPDVTAPATARTSNAVAYYDAADRLTANVNFGTNGGAPFARPAQVPVRSDRALVTSYDYDPAGRVALVTDPRGVSAATEYDMRGRVIRTVAGFTPSGAWAPGNPTAPVAAPTNSTNATTAYTYNGLGQVTTVTAVMPAGTPSQTTTYVYGVSAATGSSIASNDLLAAIVQPDKATGLMPTGAALANHRVTYSYNALGDATSSTDANATAHQYSYDVLGRRTADAVTTLGAGVEGAVRRLETAYDTQGNAYLFTSYDAAQGGSVVNQVLDTFNGLGQLTARYQEHSGAVNVATTPAVRYRYSEMAGGANHSRLLGMTYPNGRVLDYLYGAGLDDAIGRVTAIADDNGGVPSQVLEAYTYLGLGTVVAWAHPQTGVDLTRIRQAGDFKANPDGGDQYTGLDRFGRVIDVNWTRNGGTAARYQYGYDRSGNVLYRADLVDLAMSELYHPDSQSAGDDNTAYDALGRLRGYRRGILKSQHNFGSYDAVPNASADRMWSLDALGNWVGTSDFGGYSGTTTRSFNAANQETSSSAGVAPTFDANGNTLSDREKSYTYDAWNRLVAVRDSATNTLLAGYQFDALRRRIVETHGATTTHLYFTPEWNVVEERVDGTSTANTATQYVLGMSGSIILRDQFTNGVVDASARIYPAKDISDNIIAIIDLAGQVIERYIYDSYGDVTVFDGVGGVRPGNSSQYNWQYGFKGGRLDFSTGLHLFQHRDYDSSRGSWLQRDPLGLIGDGANLYKFASNNPILFGDPTGLAPEFPETHADCYQMFKWLVERAERKRDKDIAEAEQLLNPPLPIYGIPSDPTKPRPIIGTRPNPNPQPPSSARQKFVELAIAAAKAAYAEAMIEAVLWWRACDAYVDAKNLCKQAKLWWELLPTLLPTLLPKPPKLPDLPPFLPPIRLPKPGPGHKGCPICDPLPGLGW